MGFENSWLVPGKVVYSRVIGKITLEELSNVSEMTIKMFEESDSPLIHLIIDESELDKLPVSIKSFSEASTLLKHPQMGWMIMYGTDDRMAKFMSTIITGIAKVRHRRFRTFEECLAFLKTVDSTLPTVEEMLSE